MSSYLEIGYTQKTHGVKGELKIFIQEAFWDVWQRKKRVFLDIKGTKVPYFLKSVRGSYEDIVWFEDIPNREAALLLQSRKVFLLDTDLPKRFEIVADVLEYAHVSGFTLVDQHLGAIGAIEEVLEMPQQEIAVLQYQGREVLVPLNQHFVVAVDAEKKEVLTNLPEGLLDV
ncbi:MAG: 16S rRNA processing protein RimM [Lewinellaceae bacterium]|nr:16S rRNA processing protein RimM [Lewinellaceae bacterium]